MMITFVQMITAILTKDVCIMNLSVIVMIILNVLLNIAILKLDVSMFQWTVMMVIMKLMTIAILLLDVFMKSTLMNLKLLVDINSINKQNILF